MCRAGAMLEEMRRNGDCITHLYNHLMKIALRKDGELFRT